MAETIIALVTRYPWIVTAVLASIILLALLIFGIVLYAVKQGRLIRLWKVEIGSGNQERNEDHGQKTDSDAQQDPSSTPILTGKWQATWEYGKDTLFIDRQVGNMLDGRWILHFASPQEYRFKGQYFGEAIVGYLIPTGNADIAPASLVLRIRADKDLVGKVIAIETDEERRKIDEIYVASNKWKRIS